jgi:hypothetical protein
MRMRAYPATFARRRHSRFASREPHLVTAGSRSSANNAAGRTIERTSRRRFTVFASADNRVAVESAPPSIACRRI